MVNNTSIASAVAGPACDPITRRNYTLATASWTSSTTNYPTGNSLALTSRTGNVDSSGNLPSASTDFARHVGKFNWK